ncbi:hsp90 co-chaperone Cdc37 [Purpureocillium takamizusanense]|uniref:Hsp90 chaperone protein kinase-targeting subunit n=1 Tax=Purpureocillium takamizusanense TaxID=2060973 RepID=A0A9Q8V6X3_9HYPO|nr:hsp90 co-chaperone Cdc37 [Purpureocillium takamizusanense]UNI14284.1 hsp90 co-chaperone Cdc37 [Purpureocillium takamizusanense]
MPVDYSKWDALEVSDDSDIEVHPNVDKRSFIRAKQSQIHQERQHRKLQIETYKYERVINDGLLSRISALLASLKAHASEAATRNPGEIAFQAVMETAGNAKDDRPPPPPEGVHSGEQEQPTYSKMMAALLDQVNKALDEKKPDDRYSGMIEEIQGHHDKVQNLQKELLQKLEELEKEDKKKITSADIHTGFDSSHVAKATAADKKDSTQVELLNPNFSATTGPGASEKSAAAGDDDEEIEASPDAKTFAQIPANDYPRSLQFLLQHPHILTERETDGLLVLAFDAALERKDDHSRQCVHQALLLQYCRALGKDGVQLFFKRIMTKGHQAQEVFYKDVQETYMRIRNRSREILAERAKEPAEGVEQIQLHAVEPGTVINVRVPPADSQDPQEQKARAIFDGFKPEMKKALETGELDEVNKVLGRLGVEEAEELVERFGEVRHMPAAYASTGHVLRLTGTHRPTSSVLRSKSLTQQRRKGRNS